MQFSYLYSYSKIKIDYPQLFSCCVERNRLEGLNGQVRNKKCARTLDHNDWSAVDYEVMTILSLVMFVCLFLPFNAKYFGTFRLQRLCRKNVDPRFFVLVI